MLLLLSAVVYMWAASQTVIPFLDHHGFHYVFYAMVWLDQWKLFHSIWSAAVFTILTIQMTGMTITIFLHRAGAHKALKLLHPGLKHVFRFWVWFATGMIPREWIAVHRWHHANCEKKEDPHSPQTTSIWYILFNGVDAYRKGIAKKEIYEKVPDILIDWLDKKVYCRKNTGISALLALDLILFGFLGIVVWAIQMLWTPFFAAGVINGVGHYFGYRNFNTNDESRNIVHLGIIISGEELHNNHHAFPTSACFSLGKGEFDQGWQWIRLFAWCGLIEVKHVAPTMPTSDIATKPGYDFLGFCRYQQWFVAYFENQVWRSVFKKTLKDRAIARPVRKKVKQLLKRLPHREEERKVLQQRLPDIPNLQKVYNFWLEFMTFLEKRGGVEKDSAGWKILRDLCKTAKESGITELQRFGKWMDGFNPEPQPD